MFKKNYIIPFSGKWNLLEIIMLYDTMIREK